ncbi:thymidylate synthase [Curtobacterium sp. MCLR17_043]|uniref:thymidylate synthase n=1 Tax=Curtobacterium sp. MCLR17_043 TaxID=2175627 RepID=UPI000D8DF578|nr:thymidylate synthase [Curtobacterium sp. MCLR17_043]PYY46416.1 thymidylate synthase [Curtobacterium sp. MCLR17_043]
MAQFWTESSLDDLLATALPSVIDTGEVVVARRGSTREVRSVMLELTAPRARVSRSATRGRLFSALGELSWYLAGSADPAHIEYYIPGYSKLVKDFSGAYGPRLFGDAMDAQIETLIAALRENPTTRQAVAPILKVEDLRGSQSDVPCTCTLQFLARDNELHTVVFMRSNDIMKGLPHDVFAFTMIAEIIARSLDCSLGTYTHMVGSLHLYEVDTDLEEARAYLEEGLMAGRAMPAMPPGDPWPSIRTFLAAEAALRQGRPVPDVSHLDKYWEELVTVLAGFAAWRKRDAAAMRDARARLAGTFYEVYFTDKQIELERTPGAQ